MGSGLAANSHRRFWARPAPVAPEHTQQVTAVVSAAAVLPRRVGVGAGGAAIPNLVAIEVWASSRALGVVRQDAHWCPQVAR
ncbi:MAG TPA: hypothetical protein VMV40_09250 [Acidiferrobacter sp.]|nr:hypothetical protein [Acidiferrobacter sp.]